MVVEFKFLVEDRSAASDALQTFPIRVSRNSKYVIGVEACVDDLSSTNLEDEIQPSGLSM